MSSVIEVEGIGEAYGGKLKEAGIGRVKTLLDRGASRAGRKKIEEATGISGNLILRWVNHVDLFRIKGVKTQYAELLEAAGVDSIPELSKRVPANLHEKMITVNESRKLVRKLPTLAQCSDWVAQAKTLPRVVTH